MNTHSTPAAAKPTTPLTTMPATRPAAAVTPDRMSGPTPCPVSDSSRHSPRNVGRPISGETSADSVITMPDPIPLPNPISIATSVRVSALWVAVISMNESPRTSAHGTATQRRPCRSMTFPAG